MNETAEESMRRLYQYSKGKAFWRGVLEWSEDDTNHYEQMLDEICREMIDEVCDEPTVTLVKKYDKGSFKFV